MPRVLTAGFEAAASKYITDMNPAGTLSSSFLPGLYKINSDGSAVIGFQSNANNLTLQQLIHGTTGLYNIDVDHYMSVDFLLSNTQTNTPSPLLSTNTVGPTTSPGSTGIIGNGFYRLLSAYTNGATGPISANRLFSIGIVPTSVLDLGVGVYFIYGFRLVALDSTDTKVGDLFPSYDLSQYDISGPQSVLRLEVAHYYTNRQIGIRLYDYKQTGPIVPANEQFNLTVTSTARPIHWIELGSPEGRGVFFQAVGNTPKGATQIGGTYHAEVDNVRVNSSYNSTVQSRLSAQNLLPAGTDNCNSWCGEGYVITVFPNSDINLYGSGYTTGNPRWQPSDVAAADPHYPYVDAFQTVQATYLERTNPYGSNPWFIYPSGATGYSYSGKLETYSVSQIPATFSGSNNFIYQISKPQPRDIINCLSVGTINGANNATDAAARYAAKCINFDSNGATGVTIQRITSGSSTNWAPGARIDQFSLTSGVVENWAVNVPTGLGTDLSPYINYDKSNYDVVPTNINAYRRGIYGLTVSSLPLSSTGTAGVWGGSVTDRRISIGDVFGATGFYIGVRSTQQGTALSLRIWSVWLTVDWKPLRKTQTIVVDV